MTSQVKNHYHVVQMLSVDNAYDQISLNLNISMFAGQQAIYFTLIPSTIKIVVASP